jgi:flagellum-specific ATP synthase
MINLIKPTHLEQIRRFKQLYSRYQRARDLISVGAYVAGSDPQLDQAIALYPQFERFLQQTLAQRAGFEESVGQLHALFGSAP